MNKVKIMVYTALFSSLVFVFTAYIFHIPVGSGGGYILPSLVFRINILYNTLNYFK